MKNSDVATMKKVLDALEKYLPPEEKSLLDEYSGVFERFNAKNDREKAAYQDKAEYHREYTRSWKEKNPDKQKQYERSSKRKNPEKQKQYQAKYYQEKTKEKRLQKANESAGNPPSLHEKLEKNKERAKTQADTTTQKPPHKKKEPR